jgi:hypothetical protein
MRLSFASLLISCEVVGKMSEMVCRHCRAAAVQAKTHRLMHDACVTRWTAEFFTCQD